MSMTRKILGDDQWMKLAALIPGKDGDRGRTGQDNRLFFEAIPWIVRTGSPWRDLPVELPSNSGNATVAIYFLLMHLIASIQYQC